MRLVTALAAAVLLMAGATAEAQRPEGLEPPSESSVAALRSCLSDHRPDERSQCVRQITRACVEASEPSAEPTESASVCTRREQMAWRAIIDESVAALRARESATQRILLEQTLRQGEQWSIAVCAYDGSQLENLSLRLGNLSLAQLRIAECNRDVAADRALFFYARVNDGEG